MRKLLLFITTSIIVNISFCQTITLQKKLYYTCKIWGFAKYYHTNVSTCHVNWDSVLLSVLPAIRLSTNDSEFNNAVDSMLAAAGTMALSSTYFPDTLPLELKRNRNFSWINDTILRSDVRNILDTIKNNFRPHNECYIAYDTLTMASNGLLLFPGEMPLLDTNTFTNYPDADHRQLMIFKYWNIMNYFYPYNYILDKPEDSILFNNVIAIDSAENDSSFFMSVRKISSGFDDAHVGSFTYSTLLNSPAMYVPAIKLQYIQNKYTVVESATSIPVGDFIVSVNGYTPAQMEDSIRNYVSAGNISVFRRFMYEYLLLGGGFSTIVNIVYSDTSGHIDSIALGRESRFVNYFYYPADSLNLIHWTTMECGVGYLNSGNVSVSDVDSAYSHLFNSFAIIIDLRNYPPTAEPSIEFTNLLFSSPTNYEEVLFPDVTYPGTFFWDTAQVGATGNTTPYTGTIILLFNEETQSRAENQCMAYCAMPHVIKIGSQTAGADGAITYCNISRDMYSAYSGNGIFYPNGGGTQRIGIIPDSIVLPSIAGIMAGRDEVLEKALQVGCSLVNAVPRLNGNIVSIKVYPNPVDDLVNISAQNLIGETIDVQIQDIYGRVLKEKTGRNIDGNFKSSFSISNLAPGLYNVCIDAGQKKYYSKLSKYK